MVFSWNGIQICSELFLLIGLFICSVIGHHGNRDSEICSHWNGRRHFLELGDRGELNGFNMTSFDIRSQTVNLLNQNSNRTRSKSIYNECNLELVTCADCVIRITFIFTNFSKTCNASNNGISISSKCPCESIYFSEPPYDTILSGQFYCGDGKVYRSRTRTLSLKFFYKSTDRHIFSLQYFSERNVKIISGTPHQSIISNSSQNLPQIISSPFFPILYPRDYGVEHLLSCDSENCFVRLAFTDFQIGLTSTMEIFDSNGQMVDTYTGEHFRPPIIVSSGKSLLLRFHANGASGVGYRAEITFISEKQSKEREALPYTDCGGVVDELGGAITMMNMLENSTDVRYYDCIWIIKPANNYLLMKTHISLKIDTFHGMAAKSGIIVRQGTTSNGAEMETVKWPNYGTDAKTHLVPITVGFYVRLQSVFGVSSRLAIVYTVFNYINCFIGSEFLCQNNRCISIRLHCDGFDHCGDNSDESEACDEEWSHVQTDRRWYSHTPNYYFPKLDRYPDLKTATGIFIMSSLGLLLVVSGWLVILYRMGVRARNQRELQNHLQTISELLDRQEELPPDEPPVYEAPPDYEEVIKVGMDNQMNTPHKRNKPHGRQRHKRQYHTRSPRYSTNTGVPSSSDNSSSPNYLTPSNQLRQNQCDDIVNSVIAATNYCEIKDSRLQKLQKRLRQYPNTVRGETRAVRLAHCRKDQRLSTRYRNASSRSNSIGSNTQYEECSAEFRDEPLNVSLTLSLPKSHVKECEPLRPQSQIYPDPNSTATKKWFIFPNHEPKTTMRSTFSNPETLLANSFTQKDMNYGSYLQSDRNSFLSNASTDFGSDISCDISSSCPQRRNQTTARSPSLFLNSNSDNIFLERKLNIVSPSGYESDYNYTSNADISCFGNVSLFTVNRCQKTYRRSKSFNQNNSQTDVKIVSLKRSSSVDLLLTNPRRQITDVHIPQSVAYYKIQKN